MRKLSTERASEIEKKLKIRFDLFNKNNGNYFYALDIHLKSNPIKPSTISSSWLKYLSNPSKKPIDFYIHIPFCISRCAYCNLYTKVGTKEEINCYVDKLISYLDSFKNIFSGTVFRNFHIGGGTPGIISDKDFDRLLNYVFKNFKFESDGGRCCEMSPLTATESKIAIMKKYNFHRIGIGIQSLDKTVLRINNRSWQTEASIKKAINLAKKAKFKHINVDLMVGLVGSTKENILATFKKVVAMKPDGIAFYPVQATEKYLKDHFQGSGKLYDAHCIQLIKETIDEINTMVGKAGYSKQNLKNKYTIKLFNQNYGFSLSKTKVHKGYIPKEPQVSIFGVGEGANSLIYDFLDFKTVKFDKNYLKCKFEGCVRNKKFEMVEYTIRTLGNNIYLSLNSFKKKFKVDFTKEFKSELDDLNLLGVIKKTKDKIYFTTKDRKNRFIYLTLFIGDEEFKKIMAKNTINESKNIKDKKVSLKAIEKRLKDKKVSLKAIEKRLKDKKVIAQYEELSNKISSICNDATMIDGTLTETGSDYILVTNNEGEKLNLVISKNCLYTKEYALDNKKIFEEQCTSKEVVKLNRVYIYFINKKIQQIVLMRWIVNLIIDDTEIADKLISDSKNISTI